MPKGLHSSGRNSVARYAPEGPDSTRSNSATRRDFLKGAAIGLGASAIATHDPTSSRAQSESPVTKSERMDRVRNMQGVNYWPTWCRAPIDHWTAACPRDQLAKELGYAAGLNLNTVRMWSSLWGYERDPQAFLANLRYGLDRCHELGLGVDLVIFDSIGTERDMEGTQGISLEKLRAKGATNEWVDTFLAQGAPGFDALEALSLVPLPVDTDLVSAVLQWWVPAPGYWRMSDEELPRWASYAAAVTDAIRDHPALILIEVMNEPFVAALGHQEKVDFGRIRNFLNRMHPVIREAAPQVPLTIGAEVNRFPMYEAALDGTLEVVSLHILGYSSQRLANQIKTSKAFAAPTGRPVFLSEWGNFPGSPDQQQLQVIREQLPIIQESGIAWCVAHLIMGYGAFALTALLYPNGTMRPAAMHLRRELKRRLG